MTNALPYGPNSGAVRHFLVRLAGLGAADRALVVERYDASSRSSAWHAAERQLAETIARSDREGYRETLSGPLLQLVRHKNAPESTTDEDALASLEPVAEPALAALLTLLVRDLLAEVACDTLLAPFAGLVDVTG